MTAAAPPPDEPDVKITFRVTADEFEALQRLAKDLKLPPQRVLREALMSSVLIHGLLSEGNTILYRTPDGATGEITF